MAATTVATGWDVEQTWFPPLSFNASPSTDSSSGNSSAIMVVVNLKDMYTVFLHHIPVALAIDRYTTPFFCLVGFLGNVISVRIWVMRRMRKCNSSASYLATLAVSDLLFLVLAVPWELQFAWLVGGLQLQGWCQLWNVLHMATQYVSLLLVCAFTIERFLSVCRPFDCQKFSKTSRSSKVIAGILVISLLLSTPQGFFWTVQEASAGQRECQLREGSAVLEVYGWWNWASDLVLFGALPMLALALNVCVLRQIRTVGRLYVTDASRHASLSTSGAGALVITRNYGGGGAGGGGIAGRGDDFIGSPGGTGVQGQSQGHVGSKGHGVLGQGPAQGQGGSSASTAGGLPHSARCMATTVTLLWISFYLIFTKLPVTIMYGLQTTVRYGASMPLEAMGSDPAWRRYLKYMTARKVLEEVGISHHACNIFIYCLTSRQFRRHLRQLLRHCLSCRNKESSSSGHDLDHKYLARPRGIPIHKINVAKAHHNGV